MKVKELKRILAGIPDNVEIGITDMENFSSDFEVGTYHNEEQTYLDLIMPKYIIEYTTEDSEESYFPNC